MCIFCLINSKIVSDIAICDYILGTCCPKIELITLEFPSTNKMRNSRSTYTIQNNTWNGHPVYYSELYDWNIYFHTTNKWLVSNTKTFCYDWANRNKLQNLKPTHHISFPCTMIILRWELMAICVGLFIIDHVLRDAHQIVLVNGNIQHQR